MGTIYLVGAGPGDPGLITVKGMELLKICDVVIYDRLASYQLLEYVREDCLKIYVGKEAGHHSKNQDEINSIIVQCVQKYDNVVRLKGGDPFVFGRGGEEIEELVKHNIPYEVIPGITSAVSVPEIAGIPVTHRGVSQSFHVITGHTKSTENMLTDNYEVLAKLEGTLVFLMGLSNINMIIEQLIKNGKDENTPVAVISNGSMDSEKTVRGTLNDIVSKVNGENILPPAIIVVGNTAALNFTSTNRKPLSDVKIGITGTKVMREKLEDGLRKLGAKVYSVCDMIIEETPFLYQLEEEIQSINQYQWIVFTSQNTIKIFFNVMKKSKLDGRKLNKIKFAVLGSGTEEELQKYGYFSNFVPCKYTTRDLATELSMRIDEGDKILIPRALKGNKDLTDIFQEKGIEYKEIYIYDVKGKLTDNKEYILGMNCLIFVSASGVDTFFKEIQDNNIQLPKDIKIACIGDITVKAVKEYNLNADIVANVSNVDGLINTIQKLNWEKQN